MRAPLRVGRTAASNPDHLEERRRLGIPNGLRPFFLNYESARARVRGAGVECRCDRAGGTYLYAKGGARADAAHRHVYRCGDARGANWPNAGTVTAWFASAEAAEAVRSRSWALIPVRRRAYTSIPAPRCLYGRDRFSGVRVLRFIRAIIRRSRFLNVERHAQFLSPAPAHCRDVLGRGRDCRTRPIRRMKTPPTTSPALADRGARSFITRHRRRSRLRRRGRRVDEMWQTARRSSL